MLKNLSQLKCIVNEKEVNLLCDQDTPIEFVKEALFQFSKYIGQIEDAVKVQQESQKIEEIQEEKQA